MVVPAVSSNALLRFPPLPRRIPIMSFVEDFEMREGVISPKLDAPLLIIDKRTTTNLRIIRTFALLLQKIFVGCFTENIERALLKCITDGINDKNHHGMNYLELC